MNTVTAVSAGLVVFAATHCSTSGDRWVAPHPDPGIASSDRIGKEPTIQKSGSVSDLRHLNMSVPGELRTRRSLLAAMGITGGIGLVAAAIPFIASMLPSARARGRRSGETDINDLRPGALRIVELRGKPVWILRRTAEMLEAIRKSDHLVSDPSSERPQQPDYARNEFRSIKPEVAVLVGICTHLGCSPIFKAASDAAMGLAWNGGFFCPCHGSRFDLAGRVYKNVPAPTNLVVPPHQFVGDSRFVIGATAKEV